MKVKTVSTNTAKDSTDHADEEGYKSYAALSKAKLKVMRALPKTDDKKKKQVVKKMVEDILGKELDTDSEVRNTCEDKKNICMKNHILST